MSRTITPGPVPVGTTAGTVAAGDDTRFGLAERVETYVDVTAGADSPEAPAASTVRLFGRNGDTSRLLMKTPEGHEFELAHSLVHQVRNVTGASIARGTVVYFAGSSGNVTTIEPAIATSEATAAAGILLDTLANNGRGHVLEHGPLSAIDTSAWVEGTDLYLSADTAGALTSTVPTYPNVDQIVARVTVSGVSGELSVVVAHPSDRTAHGLRETSGPTVLAMSAVADGDVLVRSGATVASVAPGASGNVLTSDGSAWTSAAAAAGGLTYFAEAESTSAPNATVPVASLTPTNAATNVDAAIVPKGTGALLADVPDGLAAGGNKRGANAVDLQMVRSAATQVASGAQSFLSGRYSTASGAQSAAIGSSCVASGGQSVAIGDGNTASGSYAVAVGRSNTASASSATAIGYSNTASNTGASALGYGNTATAIYSTAIGTNAKADSQGKFALAAGWRSTYGDAQTGIHVTRATTANATVTKLAATAAGAYNILANSRLFGVRVQVAARSSAGVVSVWEITGVVDRAADAASTRVVGTPTVTLIAQDAGAAAWVVELVADTTYGAAAVQVTGEASTTIYWVATMHTTEVG